MAEIIELIARFLVVGATAFGGGSSALPLIERMTVLAGATLVFAAERFGLSPVLLLVIAVIIGAAVGAVGI